MTQSLVQAPVQLNQQRTHRARGRLGIVAGSVVLLAAAQFVTVATASMIAYPGGSDFDSTSRGYTFWLNTLSDLGKPVTSGGQHNELWATAFNCSLAAGMLALAPLWLGVPCLVRRGAKAAIAAAGLGAASVGGGVMVAVLPAGEGCGHAVAIGMASIPGLLALTIAVVLMLANGRHLPGILGVMLLAVGLVHFRQYVTYFWLDGEWTRAAPATQKVAVAVALAWMTAMGVAIRRRAARQPARRAA